MEVRGHSHPLATLLLMDKNQVSEGYESTAGFEAAKNKTELALIQPVVIVALSKQ